MPQSIQPAANPSAVFVPPQNPRAVRSYDINVEALASLGPAWASVAQASQQFDPSLKVKYDEALGKYTPEYLRDRAAFVEKVKEGKIPEFENFYARRWFFALDAANNVREFDDEVRTMIPDLAQAKGPNGELMAPGDFDKKAMELWGQKYANRYSNLTESGKSIIGRDLNNTIDQTRSLFTEARGKEEMALGKMKLVKQGALLVSLMSGPQAMATIGGTAAYMNAWKELFTNAHGVGASTLEGPKLQMDAIREGLMSLPPSLAKQAIPIVKQLSFGGTSTVGEDVLANNVIRNIQSAIIERENEARRERNNTRTDRVSELYNQFNTEVYTNLYDLRNQGANPASLMQRARVWINQAAVGDLAEYKDELVAHADEVISSFERSAVVTGDRRRAEQLANDLERKIESGYAVSSMIAALAPEDLPPGERSRLLSLESQVQNGLFNLRGTSVDETRKAIRGPLMKEFTGNRRMDQWAVANLGEQIEAIQDEFYSDALFQAKPQTGPDGKPLPINPVEIQKWIDTNKGEYIARAQKLVDDMAQGQESTRKELDKLETFRIGAPETFDKTKAASFLSSDDLDKRLQRIDIFSNPLNDFGDAGRLGIASLDKYSAEIDKAITFRKQMAAPRGIEADIKKKTEGVSPAEIKATPEESAAALEQFKSLYSEEASRVRQEVAKANQPGQLGPRLRALADRIATQVGSGQTDQQKAPASQPAQPKAVATVDQKAAATAIAPLPPEKPIDLLFRKAQWAFAEPNEKYWYGAQKEPTWWRVDQTLGESLRNAPVYPVVKDVVDQYMEFYKRDLQSAQTYRKDSMGFFKPMPNYIRENVYNSVVKAVLDPNVPEQQKSVTATALMSLDGSLTPDMVQSGVATIKPTQEMLDRFKTEFPATGDMAAPWNKELYKTRLDEYLQTRMQSRDVKLVGLDPAWTDFGFKDVNELNQWKADGRLLNLITTSPVLKLDASMLEQVYQMQLHALWRNRKMN